MSDEEHHFESKAEAGASKTYPQQAGTIRKNGYIVIKNRLCKVLSSSKSVCSSRFIPVHRRVMFQLNGRDIFTGEEHMIVVPSNHIFDVPHVTCTDYQLIDISEDGFVSLLTENGDIKDDVRLPTDDSLRTLIKDGFAVGKGLVLSVMSAMGEEQIYKVEIGPNVCGRKRSRRECDVFSVLGEEQICDVKEIGSK